MIFTALSAWENRPYDRRSCSAIAPRRVVLMRSLPVWSAFSGGGGEKGRSLVGAIADGEEGAIVKIRQNCKMRSRVVRTGRVILLRRHYGIVGRKVISAKRAIGAEFLTQMKELQQQGWQAAQKATTVLKEKFGATRVVLFGSMLDPEHMIWHSDIDLAVWGIRADDYLRAGAAVEKGYHFSIDLIDAESAPPHILDAIHQGIEL